MNSFPLLIPSDLKSPAQQALTLRIVLLEPGILAPLLLAKSDEANTTLLYLEGIGESIFIPPEPLSLGVKENKLSLTSEEMYAAGSHLLDPENGNG